MNHHDNITRIKAVSNALDALKEKVVFAGGATISLYPDRQVTDVRPTYDIDVIVEILNYANRVELEERLRTIGFSDVLESGITCRFRIQGIIVDIMPTADNSYIGFSNKWYPEGFEKAVDYKIDEINTIKILSAPYFIATKLEAFKGRGKGDGRTSKDFEDIIYVLENRRTIWQEMNDTKGDIKNYLQAEFLQLSNNPNITEWIDGHVERGSPPATYFILEELKRLSTD